MGEYGVEAAGTGRRDQAVGEYRALEQGSAQGALARWDAVPPAVHGDSGTLLGGPPHRAVGGVEAPGRVVREPGEDMGVVAAARPVLGDTGGIRADTGVLGRVVGGYQEQPASGGPGFALLAGVSVDVRLAGALHRTGDPRTAPVTTLVVGMCHATKPSPRPPRRPPCVFAPYGTPGPTHCSAVNQDAPQLFTLPAPSMDAIVKVRTSPQRSAHRGTSSIAGVSVPSSKAYRVGYAPGGYDLFRIGHLNILRHARDRCECLAA